MTQAPPDNGFDAYAPAQIAARVERVGVAKVRMPALQTATLGLLAGAFVAFGGSVFVALVYWLVYLRDAPEL